MTIDIAPSGDSYVSLQDGPSTTITQYGEIAVDQITGALMQVEPSGQINLVLSDGSVIKTIADGSTEFFFKGMSQNTHLF